LFSVVSVVLVVFLAGCQTAPEEIPEDLSPAEMFQRAQEAVDAERWDTALRYYETFKTRFPDNRGQIVEAEYEIAFISYKQGEYDDARQQFEAILARYETEDAAQFPRWPQVLSARLIEEIDLRQSPDDGNGDDDTNGNEDVDADEDA
jgi:outer membrane protein assembly factor BamD (BamD/ComL family)